MAAFPTPRADEFLSILRERLPDKTFKHVNSVAEFMLSITNQAGITDEQAVNAGLLHDLCKAMQGEALLEAAERYGIPVTPYQREKPGLLHGPVAAEECRRGLGVTDPGVYDAIYYHTTGRAGLSNVGLALYLADFAEPLRSRPEADEARRILDEEGFEAAVRYAVETKLGYVARKFKVDPEAAAFARWIEREWRP